MKQLCLTLILFLTALASQGAVSQSWFFQGKMGGRVSVEISLQTDQKHSDIMAGYIYYPRAKQAKPILLVGSITDGRAYLREFLPNGDVSGILNFMLERRGNGYAITDGEWINPQSLDTYSLTTLREVSGKTPSWWPGNPLTPSSVTSIPGEYEFGEWNSSYSGMMGGTAEFSYAGKDRLRFNISNCWRNVAEVESSPNRPAVVNGNEFEYLKANECGYGFRAIFYKQFVVVQTVVQPISSGCFGFNASLDGVYIKTKSTNSPVRDKGACLTSYED